MGGYGTNDIWIFDINNKSWKELFNISKNVTDRQYHSLSVWSVTATTNWIIVFGGKRGYFNVTVLSDPAVIEFRYTSNNDWSTSIIPLDQYQEKLQERRREWKASQPVQPEDRREDRLRRVLQKRKRELQEERREKEEVRNRLQQQLQGKERQLQQAQQQRQERKREIQQAREKERQAREREQDLQQQLQEKERQLQQAQQEREREIQQARKRDQNLQRQLQEKERQLQQAQQQGQEREKEIQEGREREQDLQRQFQQAQQQLRSRERESQEREQQLQGKERQLQQVQQEREREILLAREQEQDLQRQLRESQERERQLQRQVEEGGQQREQDLQRQLQEREQQLEEREREFQERERQLEEQIQVAESSWVVNRREITMTEVVLGKGGWGEVKVVHFRGLKVAAKCLYEVIISPYNIGTFSREMNIASKIRHPNLLQFIGATTEGNAIILTELMPTSLRMELESGGVAYPAILSISLDVACALNYLHLFKPHPILHRDVSSANVLLQPMGGYGYCWKAKVSDYGTVSLQPLAKTSNPGNPVYSAPESPYPNQHSPAMDVFS
ncbi:PREDICTED: trichohyalin-like, partial [Amphimedon queenslandica]|uniref:Protein kinase domain-containing protein n=1 Tax=Amphimedon queenslandica TaxID=400682 RepID=A0AAN0JPD0_AMPQE